ncbi:S8 family serine peptidase [Peribacillus butanolivorans]|uniref:S8 family serine peptidase n=1 Tax=Peribacillus butanolivorans TaxID=421767 RepID=UPI003BF5F941
MPSLSTPYVAGAAAVLLSANMNLSSIEIKNILKDSPFKIGNPHEYGYGVLDLRGDIT